MILTEFDIERQAIINPTDIVGKIEDFPKIGVSCFSRKLIDRYVELYHLKPIALISTANGKIPVYEMNYKETKIAFFMSRVGAPACVVGYEEVIAMGLETLILFGTCGVLDQEIEDCSIIIPTSAIRDEGTSYHYVKESEEISVNEQYIPLFEQVLEAHRYSHIKGKTWTTDAPYRETRGKMEHRKEQGCLCVEMECASMSAVAKFRGKPFFTFFYAADNLDSHQWDERSLSNVSKLDEKEKIVLLALELAVAITKQIL